MADTRELTFTDKKKLAVATTVSAAAGLLFNVVADPLVGYFYKMYLFGIPQDASAAFLAQVEQMKNAAVEGGYAGFIQVHPTFLYESLWNLLGFLGLHFFSKKRKFDGQVALGYAAWYGLGRCIIEGLRVDSLWWGPFRVSQVLAGISCVVAVSVLVWQHFKPHDPANLWVNVVAAKETKTEE